jgi:hypothetical protein
MTLEQVVALAETALRQRLGRLGLEHIDVSAREDHDGDPSLFITAHYKPGSEVPKGELLSAALSDLNRTLRDAGETRFAYLDHRFAGEDQMFEEDEANEPQA